MREYDLVFSLGSSCHCSQALRAAGLQLASFPYDWLTGRALGKRVEFLLAGCPGWFEPGTLQPVDSPYKTVRNTAWIDKWGFGSVHDFHRGTPFEEEQPKVVAKYRRRIDRLLRLLDASGRILAVYVETPNLPTPDLDEIHEARRLLLERHPSAQVDLLVFKDLSGRPLESAETYEEDGVRIVRAEYMKSNGLALNADPEALARWLRREYSVVDYRTDEEKRQKGRKLRQTKYASMNASGFMDYCVAKFEYKVYRHFHKKLSQRGLI